MWYGIRVGDRVKDSGTGLTGTLIYMGHVSSPPICGVKISAASTIYVMANRLTFIMRLVK